MARNAITVRAIIGPKMDLESFNFLINADFPLMRKIYQERVSKLSKLYIVRSMS